MVWDAVGQGHKRPVQLLNLFGEQAASAAEPGNDNGHEVSPPSSGIEGM
jgi:hypothetical protein